MSEQTPKEPGFTAVLTAIVVGVAYALWLRLTAWFRREP